MIAVNALKLMSTLCLARGAIAARTASRLPHALQTFNAKYLVFVVVVFVFIFFFVLLLCVSVHLTRRSSLSFPPICRPLKRQLIAATQLPSAVCRPPSTICCSFLHSYCCCSNKIYAKLCAAGNVPLCILDAFTIF